LGIDYFLSFPLFLLCPFGFSALARGERRFLFIFFLVERVSTTAQISKSDQKINDGHATHWQKTKQVKRKGKLLIEASIF